MYESRIYIVEVHRERDKNSPDYGKAFYAENVAVFDLCSMGCYTNALQALFKAPIDYKISISEDDTATEDKYGVPLKAGDIGEVIQWLEIRGMVMNYRRIAPLLALLKGFDRTQWDDLQVVHYGY